MWSTLSALGPVYGCIEWNAFPVTATKMPLNQFCVKILQYVVGIGRRAAQLLVVRGKVREGRWRECFECHWYRKHAYAPGRCPGRHTSIIGNCRTNLQLDQRLLNQNQNQNLNQNWNPTRTAHETRKCNWKIILLHVSGASCSLCSMCVCASVCVCLACPGRSAASLCVDNFVARRKF